MPFEDFEYNIFGTFHHMRRMFDTLFVDRSTCHTCRYRRYNGETPFIDLYERTNEFVLHADVPGTQTQKSVSVELLGNDLTITGEFKKHEKHESSEPGGTKEIVVHERDTGRFRRKVHLPGNLISDKMSASIEDGILEVRIPKIEHIKKNIKIY